MDLGVQTSLVYRVSFRMAKTTQRNHVLNKPKQKPKITKLRHRETKAVCEFEANLVYTVISRTAKAIYSKSLSQKSK